MAAEAFRRRSTKQEMIHYVEEFHKRRLARSASPRNEDDDLPAMIELTDTSKMALRRRQPHTPSSTQANIGGTNTVRNKPGKLPTGTLKTKHASTMTITNTKRLGVGSSLSSSASGPVSPWTPTKQSSNQYQTRAPKKQPWRTTSSTGIKNLTIYERSQIQLKEREKKLQKNRDEVMKEQCPFRPNTSGAKGATLSDTKRRNGTRKSPHSTGEKSSNTAPTTATTPTTTPSSTRHYWQELQRNHRHQQASAASSEVCSKTSHTTKSLRFEELYQEGKRKFRQRPATEKAEQELRNKRLEEKQMQECTFKPKLHWGKRVTTNRRKPLLSGPETPSSRPGPQTPNSRRIRRPAGTRSLSPRRRLFETPPATKKVPPESPAATKMESIPSIDVSPIPMDDDDDDDDGDILSYLQRHHNKMRSRNDSRAQGVVSPIPPLPLEIITTGRAPMLPSSGSGVAAMSSGSAASGIAPLPPVRRRPWETERSRPSLATFLYSSKNEYYSNPMRGRRTFGIEIDADREKSPAAPRVIFSGMTVGGDSIAAQSQRADWDSVAAQSQRTEYGSI